jgi:hypothetical protein
MPIRISGSTSGYTEISAPATAGNNNITLPTANGNAFQIVRNSGTAGSLEFSDKIVSGTAVASTSGTSIDFTGIPTWVKRVTVMLSSVSTNGTSNLILRVGTSGGIDSTNYISNRGTINNTSVFVTSTTAGFDIASFATAALFHKGNVILNNISGNVWVASGSMSDTGTQISNFSGTVSLSGTLDRVRITTVNGTDTFDAGSINILYE